MSSPPASLAFSAHAPEYTALRRRLVPCYDRFYGSAVDARSQGASPEEIAAARVRREHDRCADLESQLRWLREVGFETVDCTYKHWESATLVAIKEAPDELA